MQLKLKRSQKTGGVMTTNVIFCLDARIEFTPSEAQDISRYKLASQVIYNSEASKRLLDKSAAQQDGSTMGSLKALATLAMVGLKLNISIASLQRGQHIECKSLDELMGAEEAIMEACQNLKGYLHAASAFDGREILIDFNNAAPTIVAQTTTPIPQIIAPASALSYTPASEYRDGESAPGAAYPEYVAQPETFGLPFDWNDPATRKKIMIAGGVILFLFMLHSCHVL
ncbi:hypothetical protein U1839_21095 [Sphingomonas sp. RT2P30]|uniref:hypothetical protein n=1 Tax=Parasphingomonas halimpatiens TaxID=3096162 RepID=UPI002FC82ECB